MVCPVPSLHLIAFGCSSGFGKAVVAHFHDVYEAERKKLRLTLCGKSETRMRDLAEALGGRDRCTVISFDATRSAEILESSSREIWRSAQSQGKYERWVVLLNFGSLPQPLRRLDYWDAKSTAEQIHLNITAPIILTQSLIRHLRESEDPPCQVQLVNTSSIAALSIWPGFGLYAIGKAARHRLFEGIAKEADNSLSLSFPPLRCNLRTLSYSPGPMKTAMTAFIESPLDEDKGDFPDSNEKLSSAPFITCEESAAKLTDILQEDTFENGAHIDVFDRGVPK